MTTTTETESMESVAATRLAAYGLFAAIVAGAMNAIVRVGAIALFDVPRFGPLGWGPIVNTTVVGVAGATAVYGLLVRTSSQPTRRFTIIAAAVLVISFVPLLVPPAFLAEAPGSVLLTLAVMHVTTATAILWLLPRSRTINRSATQTRQDSPA
ncbi:DUF6069 family protein [Halocatena marina]|uniref:DUF6069 family protein n=1 Tax=Halocatena marina TaxID=2934937 RepID=A0ABD5YIS6_9EURY|nr:DUF6069 family protein [Halocatena marina]